MHRGYHQGDEPDHLAFSVPDVDGFLRARRGEFSVKMKPFDEGKDRLAFITDPDGVWIEPVGHPRRPRSSPRRR